MVVLNLSTPFSGISAWFVDDEQLRSFFEIHDSKEMWDMAAREALRHGGASEGESRARCLPRGALDGPTRECSVMDLSHVVTESPSTARSGSWLALCSTGQRCLVT